MNNLNWYFVEKKEKHLHQIVIDFQKESKIPPIVNNVIGGVRIMTVQPGGWASDLLNIKDKTSSKLKPVLFVNANDAVEMLPQYMTIQHLALSFYKMESGGLFQIFNHVEVPELEKRFGTPFIVESSYWIEEEETKNLIESFISSEIIELCFVAPGNNGPCTGYYGFKGQVSEDCKNELKNKWESLLEYHNSIPTNKRNYQEALNQYNSENPIEENPVLKSPNKNVGKKEKEGCFIATATYGDYNHPYVMIFTNFRDTKMKKSAFGRLFINLYYGISPSLSKIVEKSITLKKASRFILDKLSNIINS